MKKAIHQFLIGFGSILLGPSAWPTPGARITLPPECASDAVAHDFGIISSDLERAMDRVEQAEQLELGV